MSAISTTPMPLAGGARDFVALSKPRITVMSVAMAAGGMALAEGPVPPGLLLGALGGVALTVASANALNMYWERDSDALMTRTSGRPLPAGRLEPGAALQFGLGAGVVGVLILALMANGLTAALGLLALLSYVLIYTPLKRRTPLALIVGAVPGAIPPLMGWTARAGSIDAPGIVLFLMLLVWQLPHFMAIAIYLREDYRRAGIQTFPEVRGLASAKAQALGYALLLIPVSLTLVFLGVAGWLYFTVALLAGLWFAAMAVRGLAPEAGTLWARQFFVASLIYLPVVCSALVTDVTLLGS